MVPPVCHFVWLGRGFPWLNVLAVLSAAKAGGFERVVLHVADHLDRTADLAPLRKLATFEVRPLDLATSARALGESASRIRDLYDGMTSAAARADVLRALILAAEGGIYLD